MILWKEELDRYCPVPATGVQAFVPGVEYDGRMKGTITEEIGIYLRELLAGHILTKH